MSREGEEPVAGGGIYAANTRFARERGIGVMKDISRNFQRAYELVQQNMEASGSGAQLPGARVAKYINTCVPGVLEVQDLFEADRTEFLQMACYSLLGSLPEQAVLAEWQSRTDLSEWAYRRAVMDSLMNRPEVLAGDRVIRGNIYMEEPGRGGQARRSIRQRILSAGVRVSRRLPLGIKAPLKKLVMKVLLRRHV